MLNLNINSIEQIVIPKYNTSYTTVLCLRELVVAIKNIVGKSIEIVKDNLDERSCELLVGQTNRSDILGRRLPEDYIIEIKNGKIIVDGGSLKALNSAINLLTSKVISGDFEVETILGQCDVECAKAGDYSEIITDDFNGKELDENLWRIWNSEPPFGPEIYRNKEDLTAPTKYTDVTKEVAEKYGYTQEEMIYSYRQPVYAIISIAAGKFNWSTPHFWRDLGADSEDIKNVSNLKTNNWKDDNVYSIDYVTVYQKDGQFNGKTAADVKAQI